MKGCLEVVCKNLVTAPTDSHVPKRVTVSQIAATQDTLLLHLHARLDRRPPGNQGFFSMAAELHAAVCAVAAQTVAFQTDALLMRQPVTKTIA